MKLICRFFGHSWVKRFSGLVYMDKQGFLICKRCSYKEKAGFSH